mgnify:CR=1 FL=1
MKKEEIATISQILGAMKDGIEKMKEAQGEKDNNKLENIKKEMLNLQRSLSGILNG